MNLLAFLLAIVAVFIFLAGNRPAWYQRYSWYSHISLGLAVLTVAWIVQLVTTSHTVHF